MGKRNTRKSRQKPNTFQDYMIEENTSRPNSDDQTALANQEPCDTSDTETASSGDLDKPNDESAALSYSEEVNKELTNDLKKIQQFKVDLVGTLEDLAPGFASSKNEFNSEKNKYKNLERQIPAITEAPVTCRIMKKEYVISNLMSKIQEIHGTLNNLDKTVEKARKKYSSLDKKTSAAPEGTLCDESKSEEHMSPDEITKHEVKNNFAEKKISNDQSKGAIPKKNSNTVETKIPEERDFEKLEQSARNEKNTVSIAVEMAGIPAGMNEKNRVPCIASATCPHEKKTETIYLRTEDRSFDYNSMISCYQSLCLKEFKQPEKGFVTLEPGVFVLSLEIPYEDDHQILRTVYPSLRYNSEMFQIEGKVYLLEKKVLHHLDNFRTELLCSLFESLLEHKQAKPGYITEFDYLILMKQKFNYSLSSIYGDLDHYSSKEYKSKFCPGRNSKIEKLFHKQTFK